MDSYYNKYLKYKQKYNELKINIKNFSNYNPSTNDIKTSINNMIKNILDEQIDGYEEFNSITHKHYEKPFQKKDDPPSDIKTYKYGRYNDIGTCEHNGYIQYFENKDETVEYKKKTEKYYRNVYLSNLEKNDSNGSTPWISYNYVITVDDDENYNLIFVKSDNFVKELGMKHTFIGEGNKLIFGGEFRIIKQGVNYIYQFNMNSSSFEPAFILQNASIIGSDTFKFKQYLSIKLKKILSLYNDNINDIIQNFEQDAKFTQYGALHPDNKFNFNGLETDYGYDPTGGLLYYYKMDNHCTTDELEKSVYDYIFNPDTKESDKFLLTPKIKKSRKDENIIYVQIDKDRSIVMVKDPTGKYNYEYNPKMINISAFDDLFYLFDNKDVSYLGWNSFGSDLDSLQIFGLEYITQFYNSNEIVKRISNYNNTKCSTSQLIVISPNNNNYENIKCWDTQAKGSGASLWVTQDNYIIKSYIIENNFKSKYAWWKEAWVSDLIQRKINSISQLTDNFVTFKDIFHCEKTITNTNPSNVDRCNDYNRSVNTTFGYIVMEKIENTISNVPDGMFDCGFFFEYLYAKLVAKIKCGLIFTDQVNTGNCGFLTVDYYRKYSLSHNGETLDIYIRNNKMIKVFDFDQFKISTRSKLIYNEINDIIPSGGKIYNDKNEYISDNDTPAKRSELYQNKVPDSERVNFKEIMFQFRKTFLENDQISHFIKILKENLPENYFKIPDDGTIIKEYKLDF